MLTTIVALWVMHFSSVPDLAKFNNLHVHAYLIKVVVEVLLDEVTIKVVVVAGKDLLPSRLLNLRYKVL